MARIIQVKVEFTFILYEYVKQEMCHSVGSRTARAQMFCSRLIAVLHIVLNVDFTINFKQIKF